MDFSELLAVINACFNLTSTLLLVAGFIAIRQRRVEAHRRLMLSAVTASALFLCGYLTRVALFGTHHFPGHGTLRIAYLSLLFSHMTLAAAVVPLVCCALCFALRQHFLRHRRVARWTLPTWLYVNVTGVVVYVMIYHVAPGLQSP